MSNYQIYRLFFTSLKIDKVSIISLDSRDYQIHIADIFRMTGNRFLPRVETRGIIETIDSEPVPETKSMLNSQRKSI